jgi:hypothetical protein
MLSVGELRPFSGNVTTLNWIGVRPAADIERNLGYGPGRLGAGFWVLLLKQQLKPTDFDFDGTTLRSGGRLGLPGATGASDAARMRVHDQIMRERGAAGYAELQQRVLRGIRLRGPDRIAKVIPVTPHDSAMSPADQYPMGGGGLQWTIKRDHPCIFLVAMQVDRSGTARCPSFEVSLSSGSIDELQASRRKMREYLEAA